MFSAFARVAARVTTRFTGAAGIIAVGILSACDGSVTGPADRVELRPERPAFVVVGGLDIYTDRAAWEAAVAAAGSAVQNFDFTGLTLGRVTQLDTDYGAFRIVVDDVAASVFSNPGIDIFPDASCSLGSGDCEVFTFNVLDPTSTFDGPKINQLVFPQAVIAFGGDFIQTGVTAPGGSPTGSVTLQAGAETVVINSYLDALGNGFFGVVAPAVTTLSFTFVKSSTIQNDIFQVYNPAYANAPAVATPEQQIADLRAIIVSVGLTGGVANGFDAKLRAALAALEAGDTAGACDSLQAFINHSNAQSGKKISTDVAAMFITRATEIRTAIGC